MNNKIFILSIKFAPGLFKEFYLFKSFFLKKNIKSVFFVSNGYKKIIEEHNNLNKKNKAKNVHFIFSSKNVFEILKDFLFFPFINFWKIGKLIFKSKPSHLLIYNPHPLNPIIFLINKILNKNSKNILFLHEPDKPDKYLYGFRGFFYFLIVDIFQTLTVYLSEIVILPSPYAGKLFKRKYCYFRNKTYITNLLIPDKPIFAKERKYFTIAGGMNKGKGISDFFRLVEFAAKNKLSFNFRIITSSNIDSYLKNLSIEARKIILVENPKFISEKEMSKVHAESKAYFLLHSTATQSGAISVAFMNGTPVIARNIEAFSQYITNKKNSVLVPKDFSSADLVKAMVFINDNFEQISNGARKTFLDKFSSKNFYSFYRGLF